MNLLTVSPLYDGRGVIRYFVGGQVDVSGLCKDATNLDALRRLLEQSSNSATEADINGTSTVNGPALNTKQDGAESSPQIDLAFKELSELFSEAELDIQRRYGGRVHQPVVKDDDCNSAKVGNGRLISHIRNASIETITQNTTTSSLSTKRLSSLFPHVSSLLISRLILTLCSIFS
jgi:hypothetical protein